MIGQRGYFGLFAANITIEQKDSYLGANQKAYDKKI